MRVLHQVTAVTEGLNRLLLQRSRQLAAMVPLATRTNSTTPSTTR
jgi:hypothetical protein